MTRTRLASLVAPALAVAALCSGALLAHCSSSSSGGTGSESSSATNTSSSTHASSNASSNASSGASSTTSSQGTTSASQGSSGTSTSAASSGTSASNDEHDAGPCVGPTGGVACDPGNVECGNSQCAVPGHECCNGANNSQTCLSVTATCTGSQQACDEMSDCPDGQICCLYVTDTSGDFKISCQNGPTCPTSILSSAQICKTNAECGAGGTCSIYNCGGQTTQACQSPSAIDCTKQ